MINMFQEDSRIVEEFLRMLNAYALIYGSQVKPENIEISPSASQILQLAVRHEDLILSDIPEKLGISQPAVSKSVKKMADQGYLEIRRNPSNKKYRIITVTELGHKVFNEYSTFLHEALFQKTFPHYKTMNDESKEAFYQIIKNIGDFLVNLKKSND